jgi:hypothetical protein
MICDEPENPSVKYKSIALKQLQFEGQEINKKS